MSNKLVFGAIAGALLCAGFSSTAIAEMATMKTMNERTVMVGGAAMFPSRNIIQNAVNSKDHTTLVAAVKAAGLVETLSGPGPFTVFAPTNAAFAKLPAGAVDNLLKPENKPDLTKVLTYHVVSGQADPTQVVGEHTTVQGAQLKVTGSGNDLMVNDAGVVCGGIKTANATLYLIDTVLMPPAAPAATTTTTP